MENKKQKRSPNINKQANSSLYLTAIYRAGKAYFDGGNYSQALSVFRYLCLLQLKNYDFFLALATTQVKLNLITNAISTLSYASTLTNNDPRASLLLAKLLLGQNKNDLAKKVATKALEFSKTDLYKWTKYNNRAKAILNRLSK